MNDHAAANSDVLRLINTAHNNPMVNTRSSILFQHAQSGSVQKDAARITVGTEGSWTSVGSTRQAYMGFQTTYGGTMGERMRITSDGKVGINTVNPLATLHVNGHVQIDGGFQVGGVEGDTGSKAMTVRTGTNTATSSPGGFEPGLDDDQSGGSNSADIYMKAAANHNAGSPRVCSHLVMNRAEDALVFSDGSNDLLSVSRTTGDTTIRGDITVGGDNQTGTKVLSISSNDGPATLNIESGGSGVASIAVKSPAGRDATLSLTEGANSFELKHRASEAKFVLGDTTNDLLTIAGAQGRPRFVASSRWAGQGPQGPRGQGPVHQRLGCRLDRGGERRRRQAGAQGPVESQRGSCDGLWTQGSGSRTPLRALRAPR